MIKLKPLVEGILKERYDISKYDNMLKQKYDIDYSDLNYLGRGDFGEAYSDDEGKVFKFTSSKSEASLAKEIMKSNSKYNAFADIYDVVDLDNRVTLIVQEELEEDSSIEDMYYEVDNILDNQELPIQYIHNLDYDELDEEIDSELEKFINDLEDIVRSYRMLGIEASDIRPENMGYDKSGKLKAFDIDDKNK
jgi:hypothetical protein